MPRDSPRSRSLRIKSASSAVVLILAILPLVGATTTSAQTPTPSPADGVQPGSYTFEEAVALGIDTGPDPDESGLPLCDLDPDWGGLAPDESVPEEAIDDPSTCVADPKYATFTVGATPPHAGYHWNGYNIVDATVAGALAEIEIRDGQVDHLAHTSEQEEFIVSRVITSNTANGDWVEVGYGEHSWETATYPRVYTYLTRGSLSDIWAWYGQYNLTNGNFVAVRTRNCTISSDDRQCGEIYWSGQWQLLTNSDRADCRGASGNPRCDAEEQTEIYSQQGSPHPDLTGGSGGNRIDWRDTMLRVDLVGGAAWVLWTRSSTKSTQTAYDTCPINNYYRWYALKGTC